MASEKWQDFGDNQVTTNKILVDLLLNILLDAVGAEVSSLNVFTIYTISLSIWVIYWQMFRCSLWLL